MFSALMAQTLTKILYAIMCVFFISNCLAQSNDSLLLKGIYLVHQEKFAEAFTLFDSTIACDPDKPVGYFFKAAAYSNLMADYRNPLYADTFFKYIDEAIEIGKARKESGQATAEDMFFYGGAVGFRGIFKSSQGDWFGAFKDGLRGKRLLEEARRMDSTNYDISYGLGVYDYWRSAKTRILWWLPFISDKRKEGIQQIYLAIEKGKLVKTEAKYGLLIIYDNEKDYQAVLDLWETYLKQINPNDPFALYFVGRALAHFHRYEEAIDIFNRRLDFFTRSPYYDSGVELEIYYNLGVFYYEWGKYEKAVEYLSLAKDLAESMSFRKDIEEAVDNSAKYYNKALAALENN
jgi:tetratricopeptide (TPR) repeat protein